MRSPGLCGSWRGCVNLCWTLWTSVGFVWKKAGAMWTRSMKRSDRENIFIYIRLTSYCLCVCDWTILKVLEACFLLMIFESPKGHIVPLIRNWVVDFEYFLSHNSASYQFDVDHRLWITITLCNRCTHMETFAHPRKYLLHTIIKINVFP